MQKNFMQLLSAICCAIILAASTPLFAQPGSTPAAAVQFSERSVRLPGTQLQYDAAFDLMDFNGDGKLDIFMPNSARTSSSSAGIRRKNGRYGKIVWGQKISSISTRCPSAIRPPLILRSPLPTMASRLGCAAHDPSHSYASTI